MRVCLCCEFYVVCVIDVRVSVLKGCDFIFGYKPPATCRFRCLFFIDVWLHHDQVVIEPCSYI